VSHRPSPSCPCATQAAACGLPSRRSTEAGLVGHYAGPIRASPRRRERGPAWPPVRRLRSQDNLIPTAEPVRQAPEPAIISKSWFPPTPVNVASIGQQDIDFDDLQLERRYSGIDAYCQSKLALIMLTFDLAAKLKGRDVTVNALHPAAYMDTVHGPRNRQTPISTVDEGADAIVNLAVFRAMRGRSGKYFDRLHPARAWSQAHDQRARERLRRISFDITGAP
jgi:NAD(P)-dependent dehydrogenase (short-subunit alcohol dehydrogenase family)